MTERLSAADKKERALWRGWFRASRLLKAFVCKRSYDLQFKIDMRPTKKPKVTQANS
jgi:hypothetical protein